MKQWLKITLCALLAAAGLSSAPVTAVQAETSGSVRILFTHDMHDHILPYQSEENGQVVQIGGYARLKTAIDQYRTDESVLVDAGDFSMGTLFNGIYTEDAPDLNLLGQMGYDAVTFGNHEFDYGPEALAQMLDAAVDAPTVLSANIHFSQDKDSQILQASWAAKGSAVRIVEKNGLKIGLFGVMGDESESDISSPGSVTFDDEVAAAKTAVQQLQDQGAQFIVCLSHSGTNADASKSEDQILAKKVDGINVIVSGHSHTLLSEPIIENHTVIVSCGCYGQYLGVVDVNPQDNSVVSYQLVPITSSLTPDAKISTAIDAYKEDVQKQFLDEYGIQFDATVAYSSFTFTDVNTNYDAFGNNNMGDIISDSYVYAYHAAGGKEQVIGVGAKGIIRANLYQGNLTLSDVYNTVSLGKGDDGIIGYPLAMAYLSGNELRQVCEVDCSIGRIRSDAQMYFSGLKYTYSDARPILDRVQDVYVQDAAGSWQKIDEKKLYPVVCNYYMAMMMPSITSMSKGLLSITLKDAQGNAITDFSSLVVHDAKGLEVKEWSGFLEYLESFDKNASGISQIPASYQNARDTKTALGFNLLTYFSHTSKFGWLLYGAVVLLILLIIWIVRKVHQLRQKRQARRQAKAGLTS